jgi:hypothetical protein
MMDIDAAKLALEAARAAGTVGSIAWDKLCLYYRVEAIVSICGLLALSATGVRLIMASHREPFFEQVERYNNPPTRHLFMWLAGCLAITAAIFSSLTSGAQLFAQSVVPEVRAAIAVHEVIRNRGAK